MAFADTGDNKVIVQGWFPCKVTVVRTVRTGDIIGPAEDSLSADWGACNTHENGHAASVPFLPRLVAGEYADATSSATKIITAYPIAVVQSTGITGAFADEKMKPLYCANSSTGAGTSSICGALTETAATAGGCTRVVGIEVDTDRVLLFPGFGAPADLLSTA